MFLSSETRVTLEDSNFAILTRVTSEVTRVRLEYSNISSVTIVTLEDSKFFIVTRVA